MGGVVRERCAGRRRAPHLSGGLPEPTATPCLTGSDPPRTRQAGPATAARRPGACSALRPIWPRPRPQTFRIASGKRPSSRIKILSLGLTGPQRLRKRLELRSRLHRHRVQRSRLPASGALVLHRDARLTLYRRYRLVQRVGCRLPRSRESAESAMQTAAYLAGGESFSQSVTTRAGDLENMMRTRISGSVLHLDDLSVFARGGNALERVPMGTDAVAALKDSVLGHVETQQSRLSDVRSRLPNSRSSPSVRQRRQATSEAPGSDRHTIRGTGPLLRQPGQRAREVMKERRARFDSRPLSQ